MTSGLSGRKVGRGQHRRFDEGPGADGLANPDCNVAIGNQFGS
jgi:hypothetical protein